MTVLTIDPDVVDQMATATEVETLAGTPWEDVGTSIPRDATVAETLKAAGLDWQVLKRPVWTDTTPPDTLEALGYSEKTLLGRSAPVKGQSMKVDGSYTLLRADTMEAISPFVGARYKPIQNEDAFGVFQEFIEAGNMTMETAGSLYDGRHIWGLARIEGDYELCDGEIIRGYFLLMQSHYYGSALKAMFTPVRYPGGLTLMQAVNRSGKSGTYTMPHSRHWNDARINEIHEVLGVAERTLLNFVDQAKRMIDTKVTEQDAIAYFLELFHPNMFKLYKNGHLTLPERIADLATWDASNRNLKRVEEFMTAYEGAGKESCVGTAWGLVNATNYAFDHCIGNSPDTRMESAWIGVNARTKLKALKRVQEMAQGD